MTHSHPDLNSYEHLYNLSTQHFRLGQKSTHLTLICHSNKHNDEAYSPTPYLHKVRFDAIRTPKLRHQALSEQTRLEDDDLLNISKSLPTLYNNNMKQKDSKIND